LEGALSTSFVMRLGSYLVDEMTMWSELLELFLMIYLVFLWENVICCCKNRFPVLECNNAEIQDILFLQFARVAFESISGQ
jgi:hypothetical protein